MTNYWNVPTQETRNKLDIIFNKFAGREVQVDRTGLSRVSISHSDKATAELRQALEELGLILRVILPGEMITQNALPNRVNIRVSADLKDDKWHIPTSYSIG